VRQVPQSFTPCCPGFSCGYDVSGTEGVCQGQPDPPSVFNITAVAELGGTYNVTVTVRTLYAGADTAGISRYFVNATTTDLCLSNYQSSGLPGVDVSRRPATH
jgi:hypothetical protein